MASTARAARPSAARPKKTATAGNAAGKKAAAAKRARKAATSVAIATELAPAVAIALLDKTEQTKGQAPPALDCLAAGAVASESDGKVRVQLMFENGAVLPVEMSNAAGAALVKGLTQELPKE